MSQTRIKEFSDGKLYISEEAAKTTTLALKDTKGNPVTIVLEEAISMSKFPARMTTNLCNQVAFLTSCKSAGILPDVRIYKLRPTVQHSGSPMVLFITGSYHDYVKFEEMFYRPEAESIFERLFHSQDWGLLNAESSTGNVARKGYGIRSLDSFDDLLRTLARGEYAVDKALHLAPEGGTSTDQPVQETESEEEKPQAVFDRQPVQAEQPKVPTQNTPVLGSVQDAMQDQRRPDRVFSAMVLGYSAVGVMIVSAILMSFQFESATLVYGLAFAGVNAFLRALFIFWIGRGKSWAGFVFGFFCVLDVISLFRQPTTPEQAEAALIPNVLSYVAVALEVLAIVFLFLPVSQNWFRTMKRVQVSAGVPHGTTQGPASPPAPALHAMGSNGVLKCEVVGQELKQSHEYGPDSSRKIITASSGYRLLAAKCRFSNESNQTLGFSSGQFSVYDSGGNKVNATFFGAGNTIAESGAVISTEGKTNTQEGEMIVTYKGKLSVDVSFINWELAAHQHYEETLVFLVPATVEEATIQLT